MQADLRHANFSDADLLRASFIQANLSQAVFRRQAHASKLPQKANLTGADLTGAHLNGIFLSGVVGIKSVKADWIEVGTDEAPNRLEGEAARQWLLETSAEKFASSLEKRQDRTMANYAMACVKST